jgi:hypothetical protein
MSPNRIVAVLTPLVFAPLAGTIAAFVAHNFPGVEISEGSLTQIFIAGALIALAKAAQWTRGWQKYEERHEPAPAQDPFELPPLGDMPPAEFDPEALLPADDELDRAGDAALILR